MKSETETKCRCESATAEKYPMHPILFHRNPFSHKYKKLYKCLILELNPILFQQSYENQRNRFVGPCRHFSGTGVKFLSVLKYGESDGMYGRRPADTQRVGRIIFSFRFGSANSWPELRGSKISTPHIPHLISTQYVSISMAGSMKYCRWKKHLEPTISVRRRGRGERCTFILPSA
jgi:hypothetical protein